MRLPLLKLEGGRFSSLSASCALTIIYAHTATFLVDTAMPGAYRPRCYRLDPVVHSLAHRFGSAEPDVTGLGLNTTFGHDCHPAPIKSR